jgi:pilus assembly protein CpaE
MFQVITVSASAERGHFLRHLVHATGQLLLLRELETPLDELGAHKALALHHPDVMVVDLTGGEEGALAAYLLKRGSPGTPIVGIGGSEEVRASVGQIGVAAFTSDRPEAAELLSAVGVALHHSCGVLEEKLLSFLPAKAGSGCTTVVANTAAALARLGRKVLVVEADLRSGVLPFLLDLRVRHSLQGLLSDSSAIDSFRVHNCVEQAHEVDWLLSSRAIDAPLPCWYDYFRLLEAVRPRYDFILVDLPELVNAATVEFVRRSRRVYAVCTPELLSMRLCQQRLAELEHWSVPTERTQLVVNRWHTDDLAPAEVERTIGRPVAQILPNSYPAVRAAATEGRPVDPESRLGQAYAEFASRVAGVEYKAAAAGLGGRLRAVFSRG